MTETMFRCPHCKAVLAVDSRYAGAATVCPQCQTGMLVPAVQEPEEADLRRAPARWPRFLLMAVLLILILAAPVAGFLMGYTHGLRIGDGYGFTRGFAIGKRDGHAEGRLQGTLDGEAKGRVGGRDAGYLEGRQAGLAEGERKGTAQGRIDGLAEGRRLATAEAEKLAFAEGEKQGFAAGRKEGFAAGKLEGIAEGNRAGQVHAEGVASRRYNEGVAAGRQEGFAEGMKKGIEDGEKQGWTNGMKAAWFILNLKKGATEADVVKWFGMPTREEGTVGESALTMVYGDVRIHVVTAYDGIRKVDFWSGDLMALLDQKVNGTKPAR
jgi:flagellar biosynthesis/type III secretory pathway protein FliH